MLQKETGFDLPAKIEDFVSQKCLTSCINGQYTSVTSDKTFDVIDPGSGNRLAVVADRRGEGFQELRMGHYACQ